MKKLILYVACAALFCNVSFARDIVYKVSTYGNDDNDGLTWSTAKRTVQAAIASAEYGDDVWVAAGSYYPTDGESNRFRWGGSSDSDLRYFSFKLKSGVRIYGGFPKIGNPDMNDRDIENNQTIFSGNIGDASSNTDNSYRIIYSNDASIDDLTVLDGVYVQEAYNDSSDGNGGGMYNSAGAPIVRNVVFSMNYAASKGGAVYNRSSTSPILENSVFENNYVMSAYLRANTLFGGYTLSSVEGDSGSAIAHEGSANLSIINCKFKNNSHSAIEAIGDIEIYGGDFVQNYNGIYISGKKNISISNCSFNGNTGNCVKIKEGEDPYLNIVNTTFSSNQNVVILNLNKNSLVDKCSFYRNRHNLRNAEEKELSMGDASVNIEVVEMGVVKMINGSISNCVFRDNYVRVSLSGSAKITRGEGQYSSMQASSTVSFYSAGVVYMEDGEINFCTFENNGSVSETSSSATSYVMATRTVSGNRAFAYNYSYCVGAVYMKNGKINACSFINNYSNTSTKTYAYNNGRTYYSNNSISKDEAISYSAGAILLMMDSYMPNRCNVVNCTFNNNFSDDSCNSTKPTLYSASAILSKFGIVKNCTFSENYAKNTSTGTVCSIEGSSLLDSILWGNYFSGSYSETSGTFKEVNNCIIQSDYDDTAQDPKLLPLGNYGGNTLTMPVGPSSAAINKGGNGTATTDQRGYSRSSNSTIGACEYQQTVQNIKITTKEGEDVFAPNKTFTLKANTDCDVLEYIWTKNGEIVEANEDGTLTDALP